MDAVKKATILSQALPYIQKYNNKIIVIKYGGNAMINEDLQRNVIKDVVLLSTIGVKVVMVHGGGPKINEMLKKINKESKFINGLRQTDEETMDIVQMVLAGQTNKDLVSKISQAGAKAVGISGMDSCLIEAKCNNKEQLGYVGAVTNINEKIIVDLLDNGYIPVIASVGCDENNHACNINADLAASAIAAKLEAENMILVSNVPGILNDKNDESSIVPTITLSQIETFKEEGIIAGGMIPKVDCCVDAVKNGVKKSCIIDGRVPHSLLIEILSDDGIGTMIMEG